MRKKRDIVYLFAEVRGLDILYFCCSVFSRTFVFVVFAFQQKKILVIIIIIISISIRKYSRSNMNNCFASYEDATAARIEAKVRAADF